MSQCVNICILLSPQLSHFSDWLIPAEIAKPHTDDQFSSDVEQINNTFHPFFIIVILIEQYLPFSTFSMVTNGNCSCTGYSQYGTYHGTSPATNLKNDHSQDQ